MTNREKLSTFYNKYGYIPKLWPRNNLCNNQISILKLELFGHSWYRYISFKDNSILFYD